MIYLKKSFLSNKVNIQTVVISDDDTLFLFYKDQQNIFQAGMSLDFSDFQAETSLKCP